MAHIRLENVSKNFGSHSALKGLDLEIADGEFFVLLGPTGAGKTTTLRLIAGLERPNAGAIRIDHEDVREWNAAQRDVALVFQHYSLYPRYTVRQNPNFPENRCAAIRNRRSTRVARAAKTLRIEYLLDRKTDRLSGGEMQRVSIGRASCANPRLPDGRAASNLDAAARGAALGAQGFADEAGRHLPVRHP
jgi:multiple sugar transport system ATP-binding protein